MSNIFFGKCKDYSFVPDNKREWLTYLEENDGKEVFINIDKVKGVRSLDQNAYLWGLVYKVIADSTGSSETELHEVFKRMFLPPKFITWKDKTIKVPGSTSKLNKTEFGEYIERIRAEVANLGIIIPNANQKGVDIVYPLEDNKTVF